VSDFTPIGSAVPLGVGALEGTRLAELRRQVSKGAEQAVARELQVICFANLLAAMRKTLPQSGFLPASPARTVYDGVFDRAVAEALAKGDPLGLGERLGEAPAGLKDPPAPAER
jgi:Rod binding domain-containing protein